MLVTVVVSNVFCLHVHMPPMCQVLSQLLATPEEETSVLWDHSCDKYHHEGSARRMVLSMA